MKAKLGWRSVWNSEVRRVAPKYLMPTFTVILTQIIVRDLLHAPWLRRVGKDTRRIHPIEEIIHVRPLPPLTVALGQKVTPRAREAGAMQKNPAGMAPHAHLNTTSAEKAGPMENRRADIAKITWSVRDAP
ncbi:hypothetical protein [Prosthecobacter dejongeii]|uniref:Uncharacterized protein n=1 Tax=Prosthecobacter dejongeii TaxID=48465 RepID=A0A7W7YH69_9BACT|nr:hypothetical protein [Prosthecobacter dejongeii]MBB5036103.1 hypothetical protein [Prosthecobacter dejongeii]